MDDGSSYHRGCLGYFLHPASNRLIVACIPAFLPTDERSSQDRMGGAAGEQRLIDVGVDPGKERREKVEEQVLHERRHIWQISGLVAEREW